MSVADVIAEGFLDEVRLEERPGGSWKGEGQEQHCREGEEGE